MFEFIFSIKVVNRRSELSFVAAAFVTEPFTLQLRVVHLQAQT
jgi:hypothetical protein